MTGDRRIAASVLRGDPPYGVPNVEVVVHWLKDTMATPRRARTIVR
jgi:hypothetical protein